MSELAADGIPVAATCRVLEIARQPYYRWLKSPVTDAELAKAYRANALFDTHGENPEFGYRYRYLADEAEHAGEKLCRRICSTGGWTSTISKNGRGRRRKAGPPPGGAWSPATSCTAIEDCNFGRRRCRRRSGETVLGSMGGVGACGNNAAMESFFLLLQNNVLDRRSGATRDELRAAIEHWIERTYHRRRRQDRLGRLTPIEFETIMTHEAAQAA